MAPRRDRVRRPLSKPAADDDPKLTAADDPVLRVCAREARRVQRRRAGRKAVEVIVEFGSDILSNWP